MHAKLVLTPGEPAGIGADLIALMVAQNKWRSNWTLVASPELIHQRAKQLGVTLKLNEISAAELANLASDHSLSASVNIIPVDLAAPVTAGQLNVANANYVLKTLELATDLCRNHTAHGLVTGPVHKGVINEAGIAFTGHTEFLQERCQVEKVVMLLATAELRVALATTHLPLKDVAAAITPASLTSVIRILHQGLQQDFGYTNPRILVSGLNPHAGEDGHLGREELDVIIPTLNKLRAEGFNLIGPLPADTLFTPPQLEQGDAVLAMYHDQGLPVLKYQGFGRAANLTLGLPIVRTSVDHGTALSLAATGTASTGSLETALNYASQFAANRQF